MSDAAPAWIMPPGRCNRQAWSSTILAAALDLQAVLGLIGEYQDASKIYHGIDELDQAIRDIRDTTFGLRYAIRGHFRGEEDRGKAAWNVTRFHGEPVTTAMHTSGSASAGRPDLRRACRVVTGGGRMVR